MSASSRRTTERLHHGRASEPGGIYFVTFVTAHRLPWLKTVQATTAMLGGLRSWHGEGDGEVLAATVMPDHAHVIFALGARLGVGRCVSRWKTVCRKQAGYAGEWQRDFWEHRLRDDEASEDYGLYLFLNPYRAGLLPRNAAWQGWWVPDPKRFKFMELLGPHGEPPEEWIEWPEEKFARLATGE
ncbi:MAG: transposase [Opitutaceae bacterium]|nr:transposase [Opitutaceae bacterium]